MLILSASSVGCFKACPMRFFYRYIKRILPAEETESQRFGTSWHRVLEIMSMTPGAGCDCVQSSRPNGDRTTNFARENCPVCGGTGVVPDDTNAAATRWINEAYAKVPPGADPEDWAVEMIKILYCAHAYQWVYKDNDAANNLNVIMREMPFSLPITMKGRALREVRIEGKIDKVYEKDGRCIVMDHKSTGLGIDAASTYWSKLNLDTQTLLYPLALRAILGDKYKGGGVLYDVFRKPSISTNWLTQGESKTFTETGEYQGQKFDVSINGIVVTVNGTRAIVEPGKKEGTFRMRETPEMYGARLMADIVSRTDFYFARREVARTNSDLDKFATELAGMAVTIKTFMRQGLWFHNEQQCEATFKCPYIEICYNRVDVDDPSWDSRSFKRPTVEEQK